uniref:Uncharacterized protein n=1 Tax=viral metagenome TaxID=1070528 RepID=A0A6C0C9W3_9ZZZZ
MSNATLLRRIMFAGELHVIFDCLLNVKCNIAAKDYVCWRTACHIQQSIGCQMQCCCKGLHLQGICASYSMIY